MSREQLEQVQRGHIVECVPAANSETQLKVLAPHLATVWWEAD